MGWCRERLVQLDDWVRTRHKHSVVGVTLVLSAFGACFSGWLVSRLSHASRCEAVEIDFRLGVCTCAPRATVSVPRRGQVVVTCPGSQAARMAINDWRHATIHLFPNRHGSVRSAWSRQRRTSLNLI